MRPKKYPNFDGLICPVSWAVKFWGSSMLFDLDFKNKITRRILGPYRRLEQNIFGRQVPVRWAKKIDRQSVQIWLKILAKTPVEITVVFWCPLLMCAFARLLKVREVHVHQNTTVKFQQAFFLNKLLSSVFWHSDDQYSWLNGPALDDQINFAPTVGMDPKYDEWFYLRKLSRKAYWSLIILQLNRPSK